MPELYSITVDGAHVARFVADDLTDAVSQLRGRADIPAGAAVCIHHVPTELDRLAELIDERHNQGDWTPRENLTAGLRRLGFTIPPGILLSLTASTYAQAARVANTEPTHAATLERIAALILHVDELESHQEPAPDIF